MSNNFNSSCAVYADLNMTIATNALIEPIDKNVRVYFDGVQQDIRSLSENLTSVSAPLAVNRSNQIIAVNGQFLMVNGSTTKPWFAVTIDDYFASDDTKDLLGMVTDDSWKCTSVQLESNNVDWTGADFDDSSWPAAEVVALNNERQMLN